MNHYRSRQSELLLIDVLSIAISFLIAIRVRYNLLLEHFGSVLIVETYVYFCLVAIALYAIVFLFKKTERIERQSYKEIIMSIIEQQIVFIAAYVMIFFTFHQLDVVSRIVVGLFFVGNVLLCCIGRILYHDFCLKRLTVDDDGELLVSDAPVSEESVKKSRQHVYILGSKSIGQYGGFEYFVMNLLAHHKDNHSIKYHVACKANGEGRMDISKLAGAVRINEDEFSYSNAHCFMINVPERLGSAQAIFYDIKALKWACEHIENNHITEPIVYILACRIGPFERKYVKRIHAAGGLVYQNPDGHEFKRRKWSYWIRKYWKLSERLAIKNADLVICDSKSIQNYIKEEYSDYKPKTTFIAYGAEVLPDILEDSDAKYTNWLINHDLTDGKYYISVGRFAPENNFDIMIREFMKSKTDKDFAIITTDNPKYAQELGQKLKYKNDKRIKFVGTVYAPELIAKIRTNAYGYLHGHEVGGTNPSLLESLGSTKLNLLYDVGFNREVAEDAALYWTKEDGNLADIIEKADRLSEQKRDEYGAKARERIATEYNWKRICDKYANVFLNVFD